MKVIRMSAKADADGMLRLAVPVDAAGGEFEVAVVVSPRLPPARPKTPEELGWPPGFFEQTYGSIQDEKFVTPPRHPAEPVPPLDLDEE